MSKIKNILLFILLPLTITGCNGGSNDNEEQPPEKKIAINAQDSLSFSPTTNTQVIDLRQKVTAENNQDLIIEDIESIDNKCIFNNINGLTFKVTTDGAGVCRFKYHVKPQSSKYTGTSEAIAQVVVTEDYTKGDFLPPVSRTITESDSITLDAKDLLIESGFEIDPTSVYLTGETASSDIGNFTADPSSITYQAPSDTTGMVRIFYTEIDSLNNIARPGVVYIAIGQKGNHNPVALDAQLKNIALTNNKQEIDISSYINDTDEGDLIQLIDIKSFLGAVTIDSEHSFTYIPQETGTEILTYIISDHNGGYGIGTLSFDVNPYEPITDIEQKLIFSPPLVMSQLSDLQGIFTDQYQETGVTGITGSYPTFDHVLAESYCATRGMTIATMGGLQKMRTNVLSDEPIFLTKYQWHSGKPYLTADDDALNLATGEKETSIDGNFSCVDTLIPRSWSFLAPYYGAKYNQATKVYLSAKTSSGGSVFLAKDKYNLNYKVEAINVNGELIDPERADEFITVNITGNFITIKKKPESIDSAVNVTLLISDPITTSTTKIILGITVCPSDVTEPPLADKLGCVVLLKGKNNEKFTVSLSNNMLETTGVSPEDINSIGNLEIGEGKTLFRAITWSNNSVSNEDRAHWINVLNNTCDAFNKIKLDGRDNWASSSDAVTLLESGTTEKRAFNLSSDDAQIAKSFVTWLWNIDQHKQGSVGFYGLGFVEREPNNKTYVNQAGNTAGFDVQSTKLYSGTYTYPSCWSKN